MVLVSTYIERDANDTASIDIRIENYVLTYTFPIVPKYLRDTFDFRYFEYFFYLYRGENSDTTIQSPHGCGMVLKDGVLHITVNSSNGNINLSIPHDERIKKLIYECASMYLQYHKTQKSAIPRIYTDVLEQDRVKFQN